MAAAAFRVLENWRTPPRVAVMGDSITEGPNSEAGFLGYVDQLQERLGAGWEVTNYGEGGRTAGPGKPYRNEDKYRDALAAGFDVVLIALGTNDAAYKYWDGETFDAEIFVEAYKDLIGDVLAKAPKATVKGILLGKPPPITGRYDQWDRATIFDVLPGLIDDVRKWAEDAYPRPRRNLPFSGRPRNIHVAAAASPRRASAEDLHGTRHTRRYGVYVDDVDFFESLGGKTGDAPEESVRPGGNLLGLHEDDAHAPTHLGP